MLFVYQASIDKMSSILYISLANGYYRVMSKASKNQPPAEEVQSVETEDFKDKWQRALAELENNRKRHEQDKETFKKFVLEGFIADLIPVVDNFYRATEHIPQEQQNTPWVAGIQYIQKNLLDVLEQRGVGEMLVKPGDVFNPELHEAIAAEDNPDTPEDHIISIKNRGYRLYDRVIRPAQVVVRKKE